MPSLLLTGDEDKFPVSLMEKVRAHRLPVSFLGRLTPEEMKAVYSRSVLVFPSYLETVGLPLLEAKALSRPIIAADLEYARESVGDYDKVHYFSALDPDALAVAIEEAFK